MAAKGSLGVFIDSKTVYAAFVSGAEQTTCSVPVAGAPEDLDYDAKITDAVRSAVQQLAPGQKTAYLAVPGESAMVRCFELPVLPKKEEPVAIRFEAQKYVPFDLKDLCYDYETIPDAARKRMSVLFYAGRRNVVERLLATIESAGVAVPAVEILSNSLARSFNQEIVKNSGAIYILIRASENRAAEIIAAKNQTVLLSRHVALNQMPGSAQWDATPFLAELRLSLDYFNDIFKGQSISKIYVSAPAREDMQALTETISRAFSVPVEAVSSAAGAAAGLAVAHGLALHDAASGKGKKINIKPAAGTADGAPAKTETLKDFATKVLIGSLVAFVGAYFFFGQQAKKAQGEIRRLEAGFQSSPNTPVTLSKAALEERKLLLDQRIAYLAELIDKRRFFTLKMNALAKSVPPEVKLVSFGYDDDVSLKGVSVVLLRMDGYVPAEDSAAGVAILGKFVSALQADKDFMKGFSQIKITSTKTSTTPAGAPAVQFEMECASSRRSAN